MKKLCLFTNEFPYGNWEAYLETEVKYYDKFDDVLIFSLQLRKDNSKKIRNIDCKAEIYPVYYASRLTYFLYSFVSLFDKNLYKELGNLIRNKRFNFKRLIQLFVFISRSQRSKENKAGLARMIIETEKSGILKEIITSNNEDDDIVEITFFKEINDEIRKFENSNDCIGQIIVKANNLEQCEEKIEKITSNIKLVID